MHCQVDDVRWRRLASDRVTGDLKARGVEISARQIASDRVHRLASVGVG